MAKPQQPQQRHGGIVEAASEVAVTPWRSHCSHSNGMELIVEAASEVAVAPWRSHCSRSNGMELIVEAASEVAVTPWRSHCSKSSRGLSAATPPE